jgi:hypothetical protein
MSSKTWSVVGLIAVATTLIVVAGCGGGTSSDTVRNAPDAAPPVVKNDDAKAGAPDKPKAKSGGTGQPYTADMAKGSIKGVVSFDGKAPKMTNIAVSEESCKMHHGEKGLKKEDLVVSEDGKVANVVVYISDDMGKSYNFDNYSLPNAHINQLGCQYLPHVLAMMTGQRLDIESSDPVGHNIHGIPKSSDEFNLSQTSKGILPQHPKYDTPELGAVIKCDVHGWMKALVCVFDHPFFAVTNDKGEYEIKLPPGSYTVTTWQEIGKTKVVGSEPVKVTVTADKAGEANFTYKNK